MQLKRILCPTDFSQPSYEALKTAVNIANNCNAELCVIHVSARSDETDIAGYDAGIDQEAVNYAEAVRKFRFLFDQYLPNHIRARPILTEGEAPTAMILRTAEHEGVDLIVLATHGAGESPPNQMGKVFQSLVDSAPCPILAIGSRNRRSDLNV